MNKRYTTLPTNNPNTSKLKNKLIIGKQVSSSEITDENLPFGVLKQMYKGMERPTKSINKYHLEKAEQTH